MSFNDKRKLVTITNGRIIFRNFAGNEGRFNKKGDRNFGAILDFDLGEKLKRDGWNVKYLEPRGEDDQPQPWIPVKVSFKKVPNIPPLVVEMITSKGRTRLDEESIAVLDYADIKEISYSFRPYMYYNVNGRDGITAYLASMYIIIEEDELEKRYQDVPESEVLNIGEQLCIDCPNIDDCRMKGECGGLHND